jgi:6-phosphogluconolactonase
MDRIIVPDADALAVVAAQLVHEEVIGASSLSLGVAGGSTPIATHGLLCDRDIDWSHVTAWIPDERWVPPDHEDANQRMVRETLTDAVNLELLAPDTRSGNPAEVARRYGDLIIPILTAPGRRSIIMLGMGTDGHTASLFPGTTALGVTVPSYVANFIPKLDSWRLTATLDLIAMADVVIFLVSGAAKAAMVASVAAGADVPAAAVTARDRVLWLLDEAAAADLGS